MPNASRRRRVARRVRVGRPAVQPLEGRRLLSGGTYTVDAAGNGADYTDLETAINAAPAGSVLRVAPGTYTAHPTTAYPAASVFWINKSLTLVSTGGPAATTLVVPGGQVQCVLVSSGDVRVEGFTLQGGGFGADVQDFQNNTTLHDVVLRNLVVNPEHVAGDGHGIYLRQTSDSVVDGCTVGLSYANGIFLDQGSENDFVEDCTVTGTVTQHALAVKNSTHDQLVNNTVTGSAFDGVILVTASDCTVRGNSISGHKVDGICLTGDSDGNLVSLNTVVSDGRATGRTDGTGIWLDADSDGNTVSANSVTGSPECGIDVFNSSHSLIDGNEVFGNAEGGIFVWSILNNATYPGGVPTDTVITDNYVHDNPANAGVILRGAVDSDVEQNALTGTYTGTAGSSSDGGLLAQGAVGVRFVGNTVLNVASGVNIDAASTGVQVYRNRFVNAGINYATAGAAATFDASYTVGGNYWGDGVSRAGDPSAGTPYAGFVYDATGHRGGAYADAFPFADESLGLPTAVTVTGPAAGASLAAGSRHAIEWAAPAASRVSLYYTSAATGTVRIAADRPNNGVYLWTVPATLPAGSGYTVEVVPENAADQAIGAGGYSGTWSAAGTGAVVLNAPGADQTAAPGGPLLVAWTTTTAHAAVDVQLQVDGGGWTTLAAGVTDESTTVTLPNGTTTAARIRVVAAGTAVGDTQDGTFRIAASAAVVGLPAAVQIGTDQRLAWTSPAGSATVTVQFWDGTAWEPVVTNLPDVGHFDWFVPEQFTNAATVRVQYADATGASLGTATSGTFGIQYSLAAGTQTPVYRLYLVGTKEHLYTTDANEYATLGQRGWNQEGQAYTVFNGSATVAGVGTVPEYRLYNPYTLQHLWTTDRNEYFTLRAGTTWSAEGVAAYVLPTAVTGTVPLYRLAFAGPTLLHLWTTDANEYATLSATGWTAEGSIGQVLLG